MLLALTLTLAAAGSGEAHGPSRQKVKENVEVDASPQKVWALVSDFKAMRWQPAIAKVSEVRGSGKGATRVLTFVNGATIDEELDKFSDEKMSFSVFSPRTDVRALPVTNYSSTLTVADAGHGKSTVEWRAAFYRGDPLADPKPELNDDAAVKAVTAYLKTGLGSLKHQVEGTH